MNLSKMTAISMLCIASTLFTAACKPNNGINTNANPMTQAELPKKAVSDNHDLKDMNERQLNPKYTEGMPYNFFRKMLISDDWSPAADSNECLSMSIGDNYKDHCAKEGASGMCGICTEFREINACTDDGYCYMTFSSGKKHLSIKTYGDILRIHENGAEPVVQEWNISNN